MASATEQRKIEILVNGSKATASVKDMEAQVAILTNQWKKMQRGTEEYVAKTKELQGAKARLTDVRQEIKATDDATKGLIDQFTNLVPFGGKMRSIKQGFDQATASSKLLKISMMAIPLVALAAAAIALVKAFASTQAGMDKISAVTKPVTVIFERFWGIIQELTGPGGLQKIWDFLKNPLKGFQDMKEFVKESIEIGTNLDQLQKKIERTEIDLIQNRAKLNAEYAKAKEIAQDQSRSEEERIKAAKEAQKAQNDLLEMEQAFLDMKIEKKRIEHTLNDTDRANEKELAELIAERTQFEATAAKKRASAKSLEVTAEKEALAERKKAQDEERKQLEAHLKKIEAARKEYDDKSIKADQELEKMKIALIQDATEREIAKLNMDHRLKMEELDKQKQDVLDNIAATEEEKNALIAIYDEQRALALEEKAMKEKEIRDKKKEEDNARMLEELEEEDELRRIELENQFLNMYATQQQRDMAFLDLQKQFAQNKLDLLRAQGKGETVEAKKLENEILKIESEKHKKIQAEEKRTADFKKAMQEQGMNTLQAGIGFLVDMLGQDEAARKKNAEKIKNVQRGQVVIDGYKEIAGIWAGFSSMGPFGIALAAIQTAIAAGRTVMNLKAIDKQKFAIGGFTGPGLFVGSSGLVDSTGQRIAGVVHQNEWVAPAWMVQSPKFADTIGYLEAARQMGGYQDGGVVSQRQQGSNGTSQAPMPDLSSLNMLAAKFDRMIALLEAWPTVLQVENSVVDQVEKINQYNTLKARSSIS